MMIFKRNQYTYTHTHIYITTICLHMYTVDSKVSAIECGKERENWYKEKIINNFLAQFYHVCWYMLFINENFKHFACQSYFFSIWQRYSSVKKKTNKQANKSKTGTMSCLLINGKCYFFCKIKFLSIFSCQCSRPVAVIPQSYSCADECIYYLKNSLGISVLFCFSLLKILVFTNFIEPKSVLKLT